jgi:transposase
MTTATPIRIAHNTIDRPALFLAFALSANQWQLGCTPGAAQRPRERNVPARHLEAVQEAIRQAKERFGFPADAPVLSCYEAGRDGFWLHRWFVPQGVANGVVDSSRLAVNRRHRRAKTDRLDVPKGLTMLLRHVAGARKGWRLVRGPSVEAEDRRPWHRALTTAQRERTRGLNRIQGWRASHGRGLPPGRDFPEQWEPLRLWDGAPLPAGLRHRLQQAWEHVVALAQRIAQWEAARRAVLQTAADAVTKKVQQLRMLKGLGSKSAWLCVMEFCGERAFHTRQEVGALSGLTPTPYASGNPAYEQGSAKAGHAHIRAMALEMAGGWRRLQPQSALPQWYQQRCGHGRSRLRRIGLVALARKLLIALWRVIETGGLPDGAARQATGHLSPRRRSRCETGVGGAAREEPGFALRTDLEKGLSPTALSRCHKRMQDQVVGVQRPTRREGRWRQGCPTHASAPSTSRSDDG